MESKAVILAAPKDWHLWLSIINRTAQTLAIWDIVNPELPAQQPLLERPTYPTFQNSTDAAVFAINAQRFKIEEKEYKNKLADYNRQNKAVAELVKLITSTIIVTNAVYI